MELTNDNLPHIMPMLNSAYANKTEVRHAKGNNEDSFWFDTKDEAMKFLQSHRGTLTEDYVSKNEFAKDSSGVYFIVIKSDTPPYRLG